MTHCSITRITSSLGTRTSQKLSIQDNWVSWINRASKGLDWNSVQVKMSLNRPKTRNSKGQRSRSSLARSEITLQLQVPWSLRSACWLFLAVTSHLRRLSSKWITRKYPFCRPVSTLTLLLITASDILTCQHLTVTKTCMRAYQTSWFQWMRAPKRCANPILRIIFNWVTLIQLLTSGRVICRDMQH